MAVTLDSIQFYMARQGQQKPPYSAFDSNKGASNTLLSGEEAGTCLMYCIWGTLFNNTAPPCNPAQMSPPKNQTAAPPMFLHRRTVPMIRREKTKLDFFLIATPEPLLFQVALAQSIRRSLALPIYGSRTDPGVQVCSLENI